MTYVIVGLAAIVIIGGASFFIYRQLRNGHSETPELSKTSEEVTPKKTTETPVNLTKDDAQTTSARVLIPLKAAPEMKITPSPMVSELSSLPENAENMLLNAVWYRCENPDCGYTQFLEVHHIEDNGSHDLSNLIILCRKCHAAADNHEIPEEVLHSWVPERSERLKFELDWPYK